MSHFRNTKTAKVIAGFVGTMTGLMMVAPLASAQTATDLQAQIQALLAQITTLQSQLGTSGSTTTTGTGYTFTKNLKQGMTDMEVMNLQKVLNMSADTQVSASGVGSAGQETSYFGGLTKAAVIKFQNKYASEVLTPVGLTSGTGFVGAATRAKLNAMGGSTTTTPPPTQTGTGVTVSLASDSPANVALVQGQAIADLAHFTFTNMTSSEARVTNVVLNRTGISNDSTLANVFLYDGAARVTDSATVSSGKITFNDPTGLFTIPANSSRTIAVRADIAASTSGQIVGVSVSTVTGNVTVTGAPAGNNLTIAAATLATVDFNTTTTPSAATVAPQNDYTLWQNTVSISTRAVDMKSMTFRNVGSVSAGDITNLRLYVDGVQVGSTMTSTNASGYVTFDVTNSPVRLNTGNRVIKLVGDIVGGSTRTFMFSLRQASDAMLIDTDLNQPVLSTAAGSAFSARSATSATIDGGALSITKSNTSPTSNVAVDATNVKLATFEFRASGENVKIENMDVRANTTIDGGLDNGKVFLNGVQVGSTKDLTDASDVNFTFGSSFIVNAGQTAIVDIYADVKTTTGASFSNGDTILVSIGTGPTGNAQGMSSLNSLTIPASQVDSNTITISSAALTATKYSGYGDQTMVAGTNSARLGSFVLSAGSAAGANVNTITVTLSSDEYATITNLMLMDVATGTQIGSTKATPSSSNAFSVNMDIPASGSKTIDVVANILSGSNAGPWTAAVTADGTSTQGTSVSASSVTLQTITLGSGTLALAAGAGDPNSANILAGATSVKVGEFNFSATNASQTIQEITIKVPNGAATSTSQVTLSYKDSSGTTQTASKTLSVGSEAHATAAFTGLSMYVPANGDATMSVLVDTTTVANGATSGSGITVTVDYNNGFKAISSSGSSATTVGSADVTAGGTFYVRKTIPTITKISTGSATPSTGTALYKFTIAADASGPIDFKKLTFNVATSGVTVTDMYLREVGAGSNVNDTNVQANGSGYVAIYSGTSVSGGVQQVAAGSSKTYELFGTVTGWTSGTDTVTINFVEDSSFAANASSAGMSDNMIWSDRSATSHTTITSDWINGYLLKDLSADTQSY
ncbi:MAG: hypothetical protein A2408_02285 [Candidatus Yonathbacteria bacterium RIFOXYC1_FULL_52_10]|uniref:Peptidoglycan binding-like domain-containing protein n=1 Tax=Candidatus Yonathbacteria bacterium RIFOXYD1_FULL_52_36 TaxID=1802730 RepID=A0A1G2SJC5_9BACT|nr:MAG: hypothetical protein A2408_02285 [Candidatus Yonathbacteria bacterium RIFOXYC1_FULL_52_10]OHA85173.1 MAG: hypothetical protein A2591_04005 [Candidatus Yonathbacteria bacterium RIFOXYD1_FULL_52_36]